MSKLVSRFLKDESGAAAIEYALIAGLIAVAIIIGATSLGKSIGDKFAEIAGKVDAAGK
jgi:pilus assembly protein Flp/PilA